MVHFQEILFQEAELENHFEKYTALCNPGSVFLRHVYFPGIDSTPDHGWGVSHFAVSVGLPRWLVWYVAVKRVTTRPEEHFDVEVVAQKKLC